MHPPEFVRTRLVRDWFNLLLFESFFWWLNDALSSTENASNYPVARTAPYEYRYNLHATTTPQIDPPPRETNSSSG